MVTEQALQSINITANAYQLSRELPNAGLVSMFTPVESRSIEEIIAEEGAIPEGVFRNCRLFDVDKPDSRASSEKALRYQTPQACYVAERLADIAMDSGNPDDVLTARLLGMEVRLAYDTAAMTEAARQYSELDKTQPDYSKKAAWLKDVFVQAQNKVEPALNEDIAQLALDTIHRLPTEEIISQETRSAWNQYLHEVYDPIFTSVYEQYLEQKVNGQTLAEMTIAFMAATGLPMAETAIISDETESDNEKWQVMYDPTVSSFSVNAKTKVIRTGDRKADLDRIGFEKLMMHEVVVHAWRCENGSQLGHGAFQKGLPNYMTAEEGTGLIIESFWTGEDPHTLSRDHFRYAAVAYADGMYDGSLHTEQETYNFVQSLMTKAEVADDGELNRHVVRIYRGMPDGCRQRSNARYLVGKIKMMKEFEKRYRAGEAIAKTLVYLQSAKIDPTIQEHKELLNDVQKIRDRLNGRSQ